MNQFEFVLAIVALVMIASVFKARYRFSHRAPKDDGEAQRLRDEVKMLRDRIAVLERITVEKENSLDREIERLRDR